MSTEQTIKLELTLDQVNQILEAVGTIAYAKAAPLVESIRGQAIPQLQQQSEAPGETQSDK